MSNEARGFSLIEVMVSVAIVGLMGAGAMTIVSLAGSSTAAMRARADAVADANATLQRVIDAASVAQGYGGAASFCALVEAADGPMDASAGGGVASGTCPPAATGQTFTVTDIPVINNSVLKRTVKLTGVAVGSATGLQIDVTITGGQLAHPVVVSSWLQV